MGLKEYIKGVSVYCVRPSAAREKKIIGSYNSFKYEVIQQLNPDLIFTTTGYQLELIKELKEHYPIYPIKLPPTLTELIAGCTEAGLAAGYPKQARELQKTLLHSLFSLYTNSNRKRNKIYLEIDLGGPVTFGAYSYITDGLRWLGYENIFEEEPCEWLTPDDSKISELNPDLIIYEPKMFSRQRNKEEIKQKLIRRFGYIKALKENHLYITPGIHDFFAHHGPGFILETLPWLSQLPTT